MGIARCTDAKKGKKVKRWRIHVAPNRRYYNVALCGTTLSLCNNTARCMHHMVRVSDETVVHGTGVLDFALHQEKSMISYIDNQK